MWKNAIRSLCASAEFEKPALLNEIVKSEAVLNCKLPSELQECLSESNGIKGEFGLGLVWSLNQILEINVQYRSNSEFKELYMPFDSLLFFADAGNGDQFAYSILNGKIIRNDIFVWNHEDDSRIWVAPNLEKYLEWWLTGKIKI